MKMPILFTESQWRNSRLSTTKFFGRCTFNGVPYTIVNKEGKDLLECSREADRTGSYYAIPPGEPADLIQEKYLKEYRKLGRDKFFEKYNLLKD